MTAATGMRRRRGLPAVLAALFCLSLACATGPDPDPSATGDPQAGASPGDPDHQPRARGKSPLAERAENAMESMIIGTVLGGQIAGAYGAAVGASLMGLYGFITGDVPFDNGAAGARRGGASADPEDDLEREIEDEISRQGDLEDEIEAELRRQEELLAEIDKQETINDAIRSEQEQALEQQSADPMSAPRPPFERSVPDSIFEKEHRKENGERIVRKSLDADRDGRPEIVVRIQEKTGQVVSRSEDTNYDGLLDTENTYENGQIELRTEDTNHDGQPDRWVHYEDGRGTREEADRNFDGKPDSFRVYEGDTLVFEEHDGNFDGRVDRRVEYEGKRRTTEQEDRSGDGKMDFTIFYDDRQIPTRTAQDTDGDGKPDVWEFYEGDDPGHLELSRKEQDTDADGKADVKSYYRKGKLVRREVLE